MCRCSQLPLHPSHFKRGGIPFGHFTPYVRGAKILELIENCLSLLIYQASGYTQIYQWPSEYKTYLKVKLEKFAIHHLSRLNTPVPISFQTFKTFFFTFAIFLSLLLLKTNFFLSFPNAIFQNLVKDFQINFFFKKCNIS